MKAILQLSLTRVREVVVTGRKSQMSLNTEYRVFNVRSNIASSGASIDELLASVPSVNVSSAGEISIRGNSDVMVWINGKEMSMNADNRALLLRQIPAANVESIEVMTNPSSRARLKLTASASVTGRWTQLWMHTVTQPLHRPKDSLISSAWSDCTKDENRYPAPGGVARLLLPYRNPLKTITTDNGCEFAALRFLLFCAKNLEVRTAGATFALR